jgi:hypothetical protein
MAVIPHTLLKINNDRPHIVANVYYAERFSSRYQKAASEERLPESLPKNIEKC